MMCTASRPAMVILFLSATLFLSVLARPAQMQAAQEIPELADYGEWLIVPGERVGPIQASTTFSDLQERFGAGYLQDGEIYLGEGAYEPGTILFADEPLKRLEVVWKDTERKARPQRVEIQGERSLWHTESGITLGTDVHTLELLNGKPFLIHGFEWDYGGWVSSWEEGDLEEKGAGAMQVRLKGNLCCPEEGVISKLAPTTYMTILGEQTLSSDQPAVRLNNPTINRMVIRFD